jgi:hypothetical protein
MIYREATLGPLLGFKGGTAAMMFYGLPRFSVDLDFDLLEPGREDHVFQALSARLPRFGQLVEAAKKRFTLFFLIRYQKGERLVKIEISRRPLPAVYEVKHFLGVPMRVIEQSDMAAGKLAALITRKKFAARDVFDIWFFLTNNWEINQASLKQKTGLDAAAAFAKAVQLVEHIRPNQILKESGELFDERQKHWIRIHLREETLTALKLELEMISRSIE